MCDRLRVEEVGPSRFPAGGPHRRLGPFAARESDDRVTASGEPPNDPSPEDAAGARYEYAHARVIYIERLNIAGLIVP